MRRLPYAVAALAIVCAAVLARFVLPRGDGRDGGDARGSAHSQGPAAPTKAPTPDPAPTSVPGMGMGTGTGAEAGAGAGGGGGGKGAGATTASPAAAGSASPTPSTGAPSPAAAEARATPPAGGTGAAAPPRPEVPPDAARLSGTVTGEGGEPIAGATLMGPFFEGPLTTGKDGAYAGHVPAGDHHVYVSSPRYVDRQVRVAVVPREQRRLDIVLESGLTVSGRVLDRTGAPVAGAEVRAVWPQEVATTTADGSYELGGFDDAAGAEALVLARDPQGRHAPSRSRQVRPPATDIDFVLGPPGAIEGSVSDATTHAPIAGATVEVEPAGGPEAFIGRMSGTGTEKATTDEAGRFRLGGLGSGRFRLRARAAGYATGETLADLAEGGTALVAIELGAPGSVSGRVVSAADRSPIAAAVVARADPLDPMYGGVLQQLEGAISAASAAGPAELPFAMKAIADNPMFADLLPAVTGADGRYRLTGLPPGKHRLVFIHRDYAKEVVSVEIDGHGGAATVDATLRPGAAIFGTVRKRDGSPAAGAMVQVAQSGGGGARVGQADANGDYTVGGLSAGTYLLFPVIQDEQDPSGNAPMSQMRTVTVADGARVRVDFEPPARGATVTGTVRRGGAPVATTLVVVVPGRGLDGLRFAQVGADGVYRLEGVAPGRYEAWFEQVRRPFEVPDGAPEVRIDFTLPTGRIDGRVLEARTGEPLAAAKVRHRQLGMDMPWAELGEIGESKAVEPDGRFVLEGIEPAEHEVSADAPGYVPAHAKVAVVEGGAATAARVELRLDRGGTIRVRVVDPQGHAVDKASIYLEDAATGRLLGLDTLESSWFGGAADAEGAVAVEGVPAGTYTVTGAAPGLAPARRPGVAFDGNVLELEMPVTPGGALGLIARDAAGAPVAGAEVRLRFRDGGRVLVHVAELFGPTATDASGRYARPHLAPGQYVATVKAGEGREAEAPFRIDEGRESAVEVRVP